MTIGNGSHRREGVNGGMGYLPRLRVWGCLGANLLSGIRLAKTVVSRVGFRVHV